MVGNVGVGKISLVWIFSGEEFLEERWEIYGIEMFMVEIIVFDDLWCLVDLNCFYVDDILFDRVC